MTKSIVLLTVIASILFSPILVGTVFAQTSNTSSATSNQGLVPCGYGSGTQINTPYNHSSPNSSSGCDFAAFIDLVENVTNFMILLSAPIVVIVMIWAAWVFMSAQGNSNKITGVKKVLGNTAIAFVIILGGWLLVHLIATTLFSSSYNIFNV